jgi:hypothetical protein
MAAEQMYQPLTGRLQIRLLVLKPGTEEVHIMLKHANLEASPEYEAISYCWGDPADTRTVYCNDEPLEIANSLFTALKQLRRTDQSRTLWADAICINQLDVLEKIAQVNLMGQIYSKPTHIIIWLGDDTTGLEGLEECIAEGLRLLPPEEFGVEEIRTHSQKAFREASVSLLSSPPNVLQFPLLRYARGRTSEEKESQTSMIMIGPLLTTSYAGRGLSENGLSKKWSWPKVRSPES